MNLNNRYVEIAFPMPINQTFTYRWTSSSLENPLGYRVLVPFQNRLLTGYVLDHSTREQLDPVKDVQDVLDEIPVLTKELIDLIYYIQDRYGESLGDALQTVIPSGLIQQTKKMIVPTDRDGNPESDEEKNILKTIQKKGNVSWNTLQKNDPKIAKVVKKLQRDGWVKFETILQQQRAREMKETVYFLLNDNQIETIKGKKQREVFQEISDRKEIPMSALKEIFGAKVSATLRLLELKKKIGKESRFIKDVKQNFEADSGKLKLTKEQKTAVDRIETAIENGERASILLHGVTGSGKTEVYLQAAEKCLELGRNVLALVPEISLTPQFLTRFQRRFGEKIALLHSQRSDTERVFEWRRILDGQAKIVVGTRSCVFSPLSNIGLIIFDEEHDRSYKQEDQVLYHTKDIAEVRAQKENAVTVFGSATPSVETFYKSEMGLIEKIELPDRIQKQEMPEVEIVDLQKEKEQFGEKTVFSQRLRSEIERALEQKDQVILFLNRRGYSTHVYCPTCGTTLECPNCSISMTFHKEFDYFQCHYCDCSLPTKTPCPQCQAVKWVRFGFGTERVERELNYLFPDAVVDRLDRDTTRKKNAFDRVFSDFAGKKTDILLGTQMITKGLDFEHVHLVGVLMADQSLHFPDFRASELTFQLLTQVIGRAGRGKKRGKAVLQTLQPSHYAVLAASHQNYREFYDKEIEFRNKSMYPPFSKVILFEIKGREKETILQMGNWLKKQIESLSTKDPTLQVLGPSPAPIEKIKSNYRYHLFLKSLNDAAIEKTTKWIFEKSKEEFQKRNLQVKYNIDPFDFM